MNNLKFAFRQLLKNPGFTAVAVLTLALGIGATTAMFSVVHAVLVNRYPYAHPEKIWAPGLKGADNVQTMRFLMDPLLPLGNTRTIEQSLAEQKLQLRFTMALFRLFAATGLTLATVGLYGVLAYSVSRRTREIGVRMALGAQMGDVLRLVLRQGLGRAGLGLILSMAGAFGATRLLRGFLYEIQPLDPTTFAAVATLLGLVAAGACWLPARRAARVHPMEALLS